MPNSTQFDPGPEDHCVSPYLDGAPVTAQATLDHAPDPVLVLDAGGRVAYANEQASIVLGYAPESLLTLDAGSIDAGWSGPDWQAFWSRARRERRFSFQADWLNARGAIIPVELRARFLVEDDAEYVCVFARDISDRRETEQRLAGIEARFRQLVDGSLQGISVDAFDNRPLFVNQAFAELYGYESPAEIMALDTLQELVAPEDRARIEEYTRRRLRGEPAPEVYEFQGLRKDGLRITLLCSVSVVVWDGVPAAQAALINVSDRHRIEHAEKEHEAARARLVGAMEASSEGFALFDAADRLYYTNQRYREMMSAIRDMLIPGITFREILEQSIDRGAIPDAQGRRDAWIESRMARHRHPSSATEHYRADSGIWVRIREQKLADGATFVVVSDITRIKESERQVAEKTEQLEAAYENMDQGIVMLDEEYRIVTFNQRLVETLAVPGLELYPGLPIRHVFERFAGQSPYGPGDLDEQVDKRMAHIGSDRPYRFVVECADGRYLEVRGRPAPRGGHVITHTDITETHLLSRELSWQASHDTLTGLPNRASFETTLERLLQSARDGASHALCYLDLDQFKVINDTCGHLAGDELLRQLGGLLPEQVRGRDMLARLGGDEFGLLLENCTAEGAAVTAEKVRDAIDAFRFMWQGKMFRVGTSIGVVPITGHTHGKSDILSYADTACYAAKDLGGNRVHIYHPDDTELARRRGDMQWVASLNRSLERDDFLLYQQPIRNLRDNGDPEQRYEILLRLKDDHGRLFEPTSFLRSAERFGLMVRLDRWVVGTMLA